MIQFDETATVGTSWTLIAEVPLNGNAEKISFDLVNSGASALSDFRVDVQRHSAGAFNSKYGAADFPIANDNIGFASSIAPGSVASGQTASVDDLRVGKVKAVRFYGKVASATAAVRIVGIG